MRDMRVLVFEHEAFERVAPVVIIRLQALQDFFHAFAQCGELEPHKGERE